MGIGKLLYKALEESLKNMGILNMNACIAVPVKEDEHLHMTAITSIKYGLFFGRKISQGRIQV